VASASGDLDFYSSTQRNIPFCEFPILSRDGGCSPAPQKSVGICSVYLFRFGAHPENSLNENFVQDL